MIRYSGKEAKKAAAITWSAFTVKNFPVIPARIMGEKATIRSRI